MDATERHGSVQCDGRGVTYNRCRRQGDSECNERTGNKVCQIRRTVLLDIARYRGRKHEMTNRENIRMRIFDRVLAEAQSCNDIISVQIPDVLQNETRHLRVAVYIRTAVPCSGQISSCELLIEAFKRQIEEYPNWILTGIYKDECSGGKDSMSRKAMIEMIEDCKTGKLT